MQRNAYRKETIKGGGGGWCCGRKISVTQPPCGIVKIVAGRKNFACVYVCGSRKIFIALSQVFMGFLSYKMPLPGIPKSCRKILAKACGSYYTGRAGSYKYSGELG